MNTSKRMTSKLGVILLAGFFLAATQVQAQNEQNPDDTKTKEAQAVSKEVYDQITKAQEAVDAKDYQGALRILENLQKKELTEYEQSNVLNYLGFVYYNMDQPAKAIQAYERMLKIPSLEEQLRKQTIYTLAQLSTMEEEYQKALNFLDQWFALEPNPAPDPYILYAQNLYQLDRYSDMVRPIETAMDIAKKRNTAIKEDWYVLLNFAYFQQENFAKVKDLNKILLQNWPKKRYWFQLAGAYTELGEDQNLVAAYDAAHTQGMLETESELVTMAQLYLQQEVPYKAATLLESEMESGRVSKNAKNYRLLSQAWSLAMEDEKSIPALQEAARLSDDGELYVRLGNSYLNLGEYDKCVSSVREGIDKGGLEEGSSDAQISLGMCLYNLKRYKDATAAFERAARSEKSRRLAGQWIDVINADLAREEQIRLAEASAERQRQRLANRRRQTGLDL